MQAICYLKERQESGTLAPVIVVRVQNLVISALDADFVLPINAFRNERFFASVRDNELREKNALYKQTPAPTDVTAMQSNVYDNSIPPGQPAGNDVPVLPDLLTLVSNLARTLYDDQPRLLQYHMSDFIQDVMGKTERATNNIDKLSVLFDFEQKSRNEFMIMLSQFAQFVMFVHPGVATSSRINYDFGSSPATSRESRESRSQAYKKGVDGTAARERREDTAVAIRSRNRQGQLQAIRRQMPPSPSTSAESPRLPDNFKAFADTLSTKCTEDAFFAKCESCVLKIVKDASADGGSASAMEVDNDPFAELVGFIDSEQVAESNATVYDADIVRFWAAAVVIPLMIMIQKSKKPSYYDIISRMLQAVTTYGDDVFAQLATLRNKHVQHARFTFTALLGYWKDSQSTGLGLSKKDEIEKAVMARIFDLTNNYENTFETTDERFKTAFTQTAVKIHLEKKRRRSRG